MKKFIKISSAILVISSIIFITAFYLIGTKFSAPVRRTVGQPPKDLNAENITIYSSGKKRIKGWLIRSKHSDGVVILMHGVRGDRRVMTDRARFLSANGYSVLLFDFQAHGESDGDYITFGFNESEDARAAVRFVRNNFPDQPAAVIGQSLGGAACLVGDKPIDADALILESVYPEIEEAIANRLEIYMGKIGRFLTPVLTVQMQLRFNINPGKLKPVNGIKNVGCPVFIISGSIDRRTTLLETKRLYHAAPEPKALWIVNNAGHIDLYRSAKAEYERRILEFLDKNLRAGFK